MKTLDKIKNILSPKYACPCGYKTQTRDEIIKHVGTHPNGIGNLDFLTDKVNW